MEKENNKRLTVNLEEYVIQVAEEKARANFKGSLDYYINWLICRDNASKIHNYIRKRDEDLEKKKPKLIPNSLKAAMFNNNCDFCKEPIYQGEEICKAEGYENYIHKKCCKSG